MSRRSKLTPQRTEEFVEGIRIGAFPEVAARRAGFSPASYYRYMRGSTPEHAEFRRATLEALAAVEFRWHATLAKAALEDPRWAYVLLKVRFPQRWLVSTQEDLDDKGPSRGAPRGDSVALDPSLIDTLVPRLLEARREGRGHETAPDHVDRFMRRASRRMTRGELE